MDHKKLDAHRRQVGEIENDLIDAYASNRINRRDFVRRGTILGLSAPFIGGVVAACSSDDDEGSTDAGSTDSGSTDSGSTDSGDSGGSDETPAPAGGDLVAAIQQGDANSGLDPLNMLDLGTYCVLSQSFEYLVGLGPDGNVAASALATSWTPNADGTQWTFNLREGVTWQDGSPFTSADVAATIDRMVVAGAGLAGIVSEGSRPDDYTAVVNLDKANGNLPILVSIFNPQSLVTPAISPMARRSTLVPPVPVRGSSTASMPTPSRPSSRRTRTGGAAPRSSTPSRCRASSPPAPPWPR